MQLFGDYILESPIGAGAHAKVFFGHHRLYNYPLAVKIFNSGSNKEDVEKEAAILKELHHQNIVKFVEFIENDDTLGLVTEYVSFRNFTFSFPIKSEEKLFQYFS